MRILIIFSLPLCMLGKSTIKSEEREGDWERGKEILPLSCMTPVLQQPQLSQFLPHPRWLSQSDHPFPSTHEGDLLVICCCCCCSVAKSCLTLCNPADYCLPGSSVHGISQARILDWVAISFSRRSSWPRDRTQVSYTAGGLLHCRWILCWVSHQSCLLCAKSLQLCPTFCDPMGCRTQASLFMGFPR